jgi:hypothetical protein
MAGSAVAGLRDSGGTMPSIAYGLDFDTLMDGAVADWPGDKALRRVGK